MILNNDYKDILRALSENKVKFLLVGAYAMAAHGYPRSTMDIDLWVMPEPENAALVMKALGDFGAPIGELTSDDLQKEDTIFQIGVVPRRIDIITSVDGLNFNDAFSHSDIMNIEEISIHVLSLSDLIKNKLSTGRLKDKADAEELSELEDKSH
jgi:hypothetical protein